MGLKLQLLHLLGKEGILVDNLLLQASFPPLLKRYDFSSEELNNNYFPRLF